MVHVAPDPQRAKSQDGQGTRLYNTPDEQYPSPLYVDSMAQFQLSGICIPAGGVADLGHRDRQRGSEHCRESVDNAPGAKVAVASKRERGLLCPRSDGNS